MSGPLATGTKRLRAVQVSTVLLIAIVALSVVNRLLIDIPHLTAGTVPADDFDRRYVAERWVAYLHIVPGAVYLFLALHATLTGSAAATTPSIDVSVGCSQGQGC